MTEELTQPSWFIDEGIPGVGERPYWLNEKFKTVADLGKSYAELEKKLAVVPEEYDFSRSKFLDKDHDAIKDLLSVAKEKRVPKEVMDKMVDSIDKFMTEFDVDPNQEINKLGPNAKERLTTLDNWAKANLSKEAYESLTKNIVDASGIKALEELRGKMMSTNTMVPGGNDGAGSNHATVEDIKAEITNNLAKYKADPEYRKNIQGRLELAAKTSGYIDKVGS